MTMFNKLTKGCMLVFLLLLAGAACSRASGSLPSTPVIQTVGVTWTVELPATLTSTWTPTISSTPSQTPSSTITPTFTLTPTITLTSTITLTPEPPHVTMLQTITCKFGPGADYLWDYELAGTSRMEVVGRNLDGTWLYVQGIHGWNPCWVKADFVRFDTGSISDVPYVQRRLPVSVLYPPPDYVSANRVGNEVTIFWAPVAELTEDDYRGYLVEAWVCQGGKQVFRPIGWYPSYRVNNNVSEMAIAVTDEPGCLEPSSACVYAVEKHGYTACTPVRWPGFELTPTATP